MSKLFDQMNMGNLQVMNRFVCSATYECMATESGEVTDRLVKRYEILGRGNIGLIIPGYMSIDNLGKAYPFQTGIHNDNMIPGLKRIVDAVHQNGSKIAFQIAHAGRQTSKEVIGQTPIGPSGKGRDPVKFFKPIMMNEEQIQDTIAMFGKAAERVVAAGADAIQLHAAHGYLINQFLSPFFNDRDDDWGGSDENRFRFLKEVVETTKKLIPEGFPLLVKLNTHDYTPKEGITPPLATKYAGWLVKLGIDGLEVSCGTGTYSYMNMCRGEVPVKELLELTPRIMRPLARGMFNKMVGKFDLEEGYNVEAAKMIKPELDGISLILVGGMRKISHMEEILEKGYADFISLSRPFIREPHFVSAVKEGKKDTADCISCNKCLGAVANNRPAKCYSS